MQKKVWLVLLACLLVFAWSSSRALAYEVKYNDEIDQDLHDTMDEYSTEVFTAIGDYDTDFFDEFFSEDAKKANEANGLANEDFIDEVMPYLENGEVELMNEFSISFDATEAKLEQVQLNIYDEDGPDYKLNVAVKPLPTHVMIYQTYSDFSMESLIVLIYQKIDDEWKLNLFITGLNVIDGKIWSDWYDDAKASYDKGYLVPAALQLSVAEYMISVLPILKFDQADDIDALNAKVQEQIGKKYTFPVELTDVEGKPQIFGIQSQFYDISVCPVISYITTKDLADVEGLQAEAEAMTQVLEKLFPGLTQMSKQILFDAFLEVPTSGDADYVTSVVDVK